MSYDWILSRPALGYDFQLHFTAIIRYKYTLKRWNEQEWQLHFGLLYLSIV